MQLGTNKVKHLDQLGNARALCHEGMLEAADQGLIALNKQRSVTLETKQSSELGR